MNGDGSTAPKGKIQKGGSPPCARQSGRWMGGRVGSSDYLPRSLAGVPNVGMGTKCLCPYRARTSWGLAQLSDTSGAICSIVR